MAAAVSLHYGEEVARRDQSGGHRTPNLSVSFAEDNESTLLSVARAFPQPLDPIPAQLRKIAVGTDTQAYLRFVEAHSGVRVWSITHSLLVLARERQVEVIGISARLVKKRSPLAGTLFWSPPTGLGPQTEGRSELPIANQISTVSTPRQAHPPATEFVPAGNVTPLRLGVDLDSHSLVVREYQEPTDLSMPMKDQLKTAPYFGDRLISLTPGEASAFTLTAGTTKQYCEAVWVIDYVTEGGVTKTASEPIGVTAGAGRWLDETRPDFPAYEKLFVLAGSPEERRWQSQNPHRYRGE